MSITCRELFNIFDKIGGKIKVDYYTEKATLYPQNISCNIQPNNSKDLDKLVDKGYLIHEIDYEDGYDIGYYHIPLKNMLDDKLKKIHDKQLSVIGGFVVQFYIGREGNIHPIDNFKKFINDNCDE